MVVALGFAGSAAAADKVTGEYGWFGTGKAYEIEKGHFYCVGEFSDREPSTTWEALESTRG